MFHVDCTFEDMRIIGDSEEGDIYTIEISDNHTGKHKVISITSKQLSYILAFNLDNGGEPEGFEKMYEELEPLFVGWPIELRPMP
jgi:hypothetical protein